MEKIIVEYLSQTFGHYISIGFSCDDFDDSVCYHVYDFNYLRCIFRVRFDLDNAKMGVIYQTPAHETSVYEHIDLQNPNGINKLDKVIQNFINIDNWRGIKRPLSHNKA